MATIIKLSIAGFLGWMVGQSVAYLMACGAVEWALLFGMISFVIVWLGFQIESCR